MSRKMPWCCCELKSTCSVSRTVMVASGWTLIATSNVSIVQPSSAVAGTVPAVTRPSSTTSSGITRHREPVLSLTLSSPIGEREPGPEGDKCAGEDAAHPGQYPGPGNDMLPNRGGEDSIDNEDDERDQHENSAQLDHADKHIRNLGTHELRQKCEEENRELRIQDVDQDGRNDHVRR